MDLDLEQDQFKLDCLKACPTWELEDATCFQLGAIRRLREIMKEYEACPESFSDRERYSYSLLAIEWEHLGLIDEELMLRFVDLFMPGFYHYTKG